MKERKNHTHTQIYEVLPHKNKELKYIDITKENTHTHNMK